MKFLAKKWASQKWSLQFMLSAVHRKYKYLLNMVKFEVLVPVILKIEQGSLMQLAACLMSGCRSSSGKFEPWAGHMISLEINHEMTQDMTKPTKRACAQRRHRSAWLSTHFVGFVMSRLKWASSGDYDTYNIGDQRRLRHICAVSPEPSLFAHMKYGSRRRVRPKIRHLAPLDGCTCAFEEWVYGGRKEP